MPRLPVRASTENSATAGGTRERMPAGGGLDDWGSVTIATYHTGACGKGGGFAVAAEPSPAAFARTRTQPLGVPRIDLEFGRVRHN